MKWNETFSDLSIGNNIKICMKKKKKNVIGQGDDWTSGYLLDYSNC